MMVRGGPSKGQDSGRQRVIPGRETGSLFQLTLLRAFLLPPARRDVFVLMEIQGYELPEAAAVLGISENDVARHLRRALRDMQTS